MTVHRQRHDQLLRKLHRHVSACRLHDGEITHGRNYVNINLYTDDRRLELLQHKTRFALASRGVKLR